jgi:hypothetical protein
MAYGRAAHVPSAVNLRGLETIAELARALTLLEAQE